MTTLYISEYAELGAGGVPVESPTSMKVAVCYNGN